MPIELERLVGEVRQAYPEADPLALVSAAGGMSALLDACSRHLVGAYVDEARRAGASWAQIGAALGVTRQAVQQRFVPRAAPDLAAAVRAGTLPYDARAERVLARARELAIERRHARLAAEHLLLAAVQARPDAASRALAEFGVRRSQLRRQAEARLDAPGRRRVSEPAPTAAARKVLQVAERDALRLGAVQVGTDHLLLGLVADPDGAAGEVLAQAGVEPAQVRERVRVTAGRDRSGRRSARDRSSPVRTLGSQGGNPVASRVGRSGARSG